MLGYPFPNPIPSNKNAGVPGDAAKGSAPSDVFGSGGGGGQRDNGTWDDGRGLGGPLGSNGGQGSDNGNPSTSGGGGGGFGGSLPYSGQVVWWHNSRWWLNWCCWSLYQDLH